MSSYNNYNDFYDNENYPSDNNDDELEENELLIENEKNFDNYYDTIEKTFNDLKEYINNESSNTQLLSNLNNYIDLEQLFSKQKYSIPHKILEQENKINKNDILISNPINLIDNNSKLSKKDDFVLLVNVSKRDNKKRKLERKKRLRTKMTNRTKKILSSYLQ